MHFSCANYCHCYDKVLHCTLELVLHEVSNACFVLSAPRPECTSDPECPQHLACIQEKCQNPCFTESCGIKAECKVKNHRAFCVCMFGYEGDPYTLCEERKKTNIGLTSYNIRLALELAIMSFFP